MKVKGLLFASLAVVAAMLVFAFAVVSRLPEGAQLPVHFNAAGEPDRWQDAWTALLIAPGILLFTALLAAALPSIEPLQDKLEGSAPLLRVVWAGMIGLMLFVHVSIAAPALGWELPPRLFYLVVGLFLIVLGNMLPKSRPGFFVGIRTPWTIIDTDNWIATHRLGGKLMMAAGAIVALGTFIDLGQAGALVLIVVPVLAAAFVPFVYSWWLWQRKGA